MFTRFARLLAGAVVLSASVVFAQSSNQTQATSDTQRVKTNDMPVTLIGCVVRETDYRKEYSLGRGGPINTGIGAGDEYVLVNASRMESGIPAPALNCSLRSNGDAYELSGSPEHDLKPLVGKLVEISGIQKGATETIGTSGSVTPRPTGGFDPLHQDLRLFEVNVTSFHEVNESSAASSEQAPAGTSGSSTQAPSEALPRTASPLPLSGLMSLLSFAGVLGLRARRRA